MAEATKTINDLSYPPEPDVYETAAIESSDDSAPKQDSGDSAADSASESETDEVTEDGPFGKILRRRLFPERARSRFQALGSKVDARGLDMSDRVDGRRRGLRVRGDLRQSDDETLEAKIARLRREVEECRLQAERESSSGATESSTAGGVQELGKALSQLETNIFRVESASQKQEPKLDKVKEEEEYDEDTLHNITAFDSRLTTLERALGIASLDMAADGSFTSPVLPSIDLLDQQVSALMVSSSIVQLDAASSRVKKLTNDAEQLARMRAAPMPQQVEEGAEGRATVPGLSQDDISKLNSLYGLLPTLQNLAPTVPAILERLRSLAALHTGAAGAASELDVVEKRQADTDAEIKSWTEGLKRVETVVGDASQANGRNGKMVQGWVKDLEARVQSLR